MGFILFSLCLVLFGSVKNTLRKPFLGKRKAFLGNTLQIVES